MKSSAVFPALNAEKQLLQKGLYSLRTNGLRVTWQKARQKLSFGGSVLTVMSGSFKHAGQRNWKREICIIIPTFLWTVRIL